MINLQESLDILGEKVFPFFSHKIYNRIEVSWPNKWRKKSSARGNLF